MQIRKLKDYNGIIPEIEDIPYYNYNIVYQHIYRNIIDIKDIYNIIRGSIIRILISKDFYRINSILLYFDELDNILKLKDPNSDKVLINMLINMLSTFEDNGELYYVNYLVNYFLSSKNDNNINNILSRLYCNRNCIIDFYDEIIYMMIAKVIDQDIEVYFRSLTYKSDNKYSDLFIDRLNRLKLLMIYDKLYRMLNESTNENILSIILDNYINLNENQDQLLKQEIEKYYNNCLEDPTIIIKNIYRTYQVLNYNSIYRSLANKIVDNRYITMLNSILLDNYKNNDDILSNEIKGIVLLYSYLDNKQYQNLLEEHYKYIQIRLLNYNMNSNKRLELFIKIESELLDFIKDICVEKEIVNKLWLPKIKKVITDIEISVKYNKEIIKTKFTYNKEIPYNKNNSTHLILHNNNWTNIHATNEENYILNYPDKLKIYISTFDQHYRVCFPYRKLLILNNYSIYNLRWDKYKIKCNLAQASILLLFEDIECICIDHIYSKLLNDINEKSCNYIDKILLSILNSDMIIKYNNIYKLNTSINKSINLLKYYDEINFDMIKIDNYNINLNKEDYNNIIDCYIIKYVKEVKDCFIDNIVINNQIIANQSKEIIKERLKSLEERDYIMYIDDNMIRYIE